MRMDHYLSIGRTKIHWLQIFLSTMVIIVASAIVMKIFNNTLSRDFKQLELGVLNKNERRQRARTGQKGDEVEQAGLTTNKR